MKSKIKKLKGTLRQFDIDVPRAVVDDVLNKILEDFRREAKIPGFRQGKAPVGLVRKRYQKEAEDELKQDLIPKAYQEALEESEVNPVSYPEISDVIFAADGSLSFKAVFDVYPAVGLKKYKALKVTTRKVKVTEEEIKESLTRVQNICAEHIDVARPLEKGDFAVCDVETFVDGKNVAKKRENMWIEVSKEASMLGMGEYLQGLKISDKKDVETVLPEGYPDKKYAGKKAVFKVEVKQTKEKRMPELGEELASKLKKNSIDEVREELKSSLLERKESDAKAEMKNQIMEQLLKSHPFDSPGSMVARQYKVLVQKTENESREKGVDKETIGSNQKELEQKLLKEAENKVRLYFILDEIAKKEKIDVTEEETDKWLENLADSFKNPFEEVKKYYEKHNLIEGLREQLREEKTLDFLLQEAKIAD
ncbi:MAG: trigger factor [Candidatus Omnitrophota bacterium]